MKHRVLAGSPAVMGASMLLFALGPGTPAQEGGPLDPVLDQVTLHTLRAKRSGGRGLCRR